jgi:hypothetical protein
MPGGAQTVTPGRGSIQLQPAFMSVASVTPLESAISPKETAPADGVTSPEETAPADGIRLGPDGDAQAPIPNPPNTTNKVHARLTTFDMSDLRSIRISSRIGKLRFGAMLLVNPCWGLRPAILQSQARRGKEITVKAGEVW